MNAPEVLCRHAYLPYPHSNAFLNDDHVLVVRNDAHGGQIVALSLHGEPAATMRVVARLPGDAPEHVMFDIARQAPRMALVYKQALYVLDPRESDEGLGEPVYRPAEGKNLYPIASISADGRRVLILEDSETFSVIKEVDVGSGKVATLLSKNWRVGHAHYVPGDESWVAFCHEGPTEKIPDRVWVWHAEKAPEGRCVFDQKSEDPKEFLNVGHERWGFTGASGLAVAYGCSPAGPRGLWEVFADGRPARRVFANDRCWHCDVSRDGRFALADTTGTWNLPGCGWQGDDKNRSILLVNMATGKHVALGSAGGDRHPYHPHPVFAPDGRSVLFNTRRGDEAAVMIMAIDEAMKALEG